MSTRFSQTGMDVKSVIACIMQVTCISAQGSITCTLGNNLSTSTQPSFRSGLLLDTANPSACFGIATTWNACYNVSATDPLSTTHFGVYRPSAAGNSYTLVAGSTSNFTITRNRGIASYTCTQLPLSRDRQFRVRARDVVAVCVKYIGNGRLGLVGSSQTSFILGSEGNNCLSTELALPSLVSQSTGSYLLKVAIFVNLDTNVCLTDSGTCDPTATCAGNGTTRNCSFGTLPPPASNGSQNIGVTNTGRSNNAAVIVGAACTGVAVTAVCIFITLSISCYVNHKNKVHGAIQVGAGSPTESRAQTPLPYMEFVPAAHLYDTLAPKSLPLTMKESKDAEYQVVVLCRNEAYGI